MPTGVLRHRWWIAIELFEVCFAQPNEAEPAQRRGGVDRLAAHQTFVTVHRSILH